MGYTTTAAASCLSSGLLSRLTLVGGVVRMKHVTSLNRHKKHSGGLPGGHQSDVPGGITAFYKLPFLINKGGKRWWGQSGVYKVTLLPFRWLSYYGSSRNLGQRFKYHYYNGPSVTNTLNILLKAFGWGLFSITVFEQWPAEQRKQGETWYLSSIQPLINVLMTATDEPRLQPAFNPLTALKISMALTGRIDSDETRAKKSAGRTGELNHYYGRPLHTNTLDAAAIARATRVAVYKEVTGEYVDTYRSIKRAAKETALPATTLTTGMKAGQARNGFVFHAVAKA